MIQLQIKLTPEAGKIFTKGSLKNKFAELAPGFRSDLFDLKSQNHRNSGTIPRILGLRIGRRWPEGGMGKTDLQGKLSGFKSFNPKRYRIIYKLAEEKQRIEIYYIGHGTDVYERFKRLLNHFSS